MKVISNATVLLHNKNEQTGEGPYRIADVPAENIVLEAEDIRTARFYIDEVHSEVHRQNVHFACESGCHEAEVELSMESYNAAETSVALAILAAQPLIESRSGHFALIRPPGHHASKEKAEGFCLFNNVACATQFLVNNGLRVAILDIDIHHGNGTQSIFYERSDVYYVSIHKPNIYPYSGSQQEEGSGLGKGFTLNIPLEGSVDNDRFLEAIGLALERIMQFKPDALAISMGFDTYVDDQLMDSKSWKVDIRTYEKISEMLRSTGLPLFAVLEGGYHKKIKDCLQAFISKLN